MSYQGKVVSHVFSPGSDSEYDGVFLVMKDGEELLLRRRGSNPFHDPVLRSLVGKVVRCTGDVRDYLLFVKDWDVIEE
jgi:hypothetical protein